MRPSGLRCQQLQPLGDNRHPRVKRVVVQHHPGKEVHESRRVQEFGAPLRKIAAQLLTADEYQFLTQWSKRLRDQFDLRDVGVARIHLRVSDNNSAAILRSRAMPERTASNRASSA